MNAYNMGYNAYNNGIADNDNPFCPLIESYQFMEWRRGWYQAKAQVMEICANA